MILNLAFTLQYFNKCVHRVQVFRLWPQRALTTHQHPNVVSPLATFTAAHLSSGCSTGIDNVAVLHATTVIDFHRYWQQQQGDSSCVEQTACLTLARLISAAIYLRQHSPEMPRLLPRSVVMTVLDSGECYPLLRPSTRVSAGSDASLTVADDVAELILVMLQLDKPAPSGCGDTDKPTWSGCGDTGRAAVKRDKPPVSSVEVVAGISPQSSHCRCLQLVVCCLREKTGELCGEGLMESLQLLEFTLWGPCEDEARAVAVSDTALRVWLSITRCRLLAELAVFEGTSQHGLELAERAAFLSSSNEKSLLDVTRLMFR